MAQAALVKDAIEAGKKFVEALDQEGKKPTAAMWFYRAEPQDWVFVIARPEYDTIGPIASYESVQSIFDKHKAELAPLEFSDIVVAPTFTPLFKVLRMVVKTGPDDFVDIRFKGNVIDGNVIDDAYLYRMAV